MRLKKKERERKFERWGAKDTSVNRYTNKEATDSKISYLSKSTILASFSRLILHVYDYLVDTVKLNPYYLFLWIIFTRPELESQDSSR
jgi:hypothetical protein